MARKIWVKRPGASATLVPVGEGDLVDDVRDMILKKYANSLGRSFDAPDVTLRILSREQLQRGSREGERTLGPEEPLLRTLESYFPGGQRVEEALIIDVPVRRTPRASPRSISHLPHYYAEEVRSGEGNDYFSVNAMPSPHLSGTVSNISGHPGSHQQPIQSIAILNTGQLPPLPSPGSVRPRHHGRARVVRTHTSSPTMVMGSAGASTNDPKQAIPAAPPLPTSPRVDTTLSLMGPPPRIASPRIKAPKRNRKSIDRPQLPAGLLDGSVPPINVLLVEDNIINLKLLEAFMKRLKVRWQTAMNGRDAVTKWRAGGFHLVLMDLQLPILSGLDATKEIRRLERINSIGVFSSATPSTEEALGLGEEPKGDDKLENAEVFKSPVIIVALTASSLQSDRHEALAAGCNDFLTKPVNYVWLERKVMEWGCMQALIDFDGWRKWRDFASSSPSTATTAATISSPTTKDNNNNASNNNAKLGGSGKGGGGKAGTAATTAAAAGRKEKLRTGSVESVKAIAAGAG